MTAFELIQKHYRQRDLAALDWKKKGGKVVGYFCDNVPDELILAAGFFPLRLSSDPKSGMDVARKHAAGRREDFVSSMFNMLLTGRYDFVDFLIVPHARDSVHRLYQILVDVKASNPELKLSELYYLDNLHTPFYWSEIYNRDKWLELKEKLEEWSEETVSNESLSRAIAIGNENKMLLKKIADLRAADPPRVSGVEALQIIGSSMFLLKEEHNKLLKEYLEGAEKLPARNGARLFVEGSPLDNLQLYEIIESCNAMIVAEDNCWGNRSTDVPVNTSIEPQIEAIVDRYHRKSPCNRMFPMRRRVDYCLQSAKDANVQGVIFYVYEFDDTEAWETPDKIKRLSEIGIPTLYLKQQP
ncbi:2-hydroxyacyl-CoA dehydratase subunit D, partial [Thermodesulfobacteriota bacterium]